MPRYKCILEYDGSSFYGWLRQDNVPSVQKTIEDAIKSFCGENVTIYTAGRTDAGVHALAQTIHFDLKEKRDPFKIISAINHHVRPKPVVLLDVSEVNEDFHARFSAQKRHYMYRIINRREPLALDHNRAWHVPVILDDSLMQKAAQYLIGQHDFSSFRDSQCQAKSPIRTIDQVKIERKNNDIYIYVSAKSFLHHMVRNITGTLKLVGEGKWKPEDMVTILNAKKREAAGPTAPACGLYFVSVDYSNGVSTTH